VTEIQRQGQRSFSEAKDEVFEELMAELPAHVQIEENDDQIVKKQKWMIYFGTKILEETTVWRDSFCSLQSGCVFFLFFFFILFPHSSKTFVFIFWRGKPQKISRKE